MENVLFVREMTEAPDTVDDEGFKRNPKATVTQERNGYAVWFRPGIMNDKLIYLRQYGRDEAIMWAATTPCEMMQQLADNGQVIQD